MGLTAKEKRSATKVTAPRYQKATKKQKGRILEEFAMASPYVPEDTKKWLRHEHGKLNPADLKRKIAHIQNKLIRIASAKQKRKPAL